MKSLRIVFFLFFISSQANNLSISEPILYQENDASYAVVSLKWENSWKNKTNNDAVWVFFKIRGNRYVYEHVKTKGSGNEIISTNAEVELEIISPKDQLGFFIQPKSNYRGNIEVTVKIVLEEKDLSGIYDIYSADFKAYGIEMVYIPKGRVILGDPDNNSLDYGGLYKSGKEGTYNGLFHVESEDQSISVGKNEDNLYYRTFNDYQGDRTGTIPASFPKGVKAFYIMKYEPSQGQYVDFLNSLSDLQSQNRANFGGKDYYVNRGSISIKNGIYVTPTPNALCNYMSWDDGMAYADWSGLRPLTEFEYTKACRGDKIPTSGEFPWGANTKYGIQRKLDDKGQFIMFNGWDESKLDEDTRAIFGASYYWVMDLAGGLWERVVTIGHPKGRAFAGTHGDGELTGNGFATNLDWPNGIDAAGIGFRGGGFYEPGRGYNLYNPFSPIAYRPYGAYSGGHRTKAYGARFCRTSN